MEPDNDQLPWDIEIRDGDAYLVFTSAVFAGAFIADITDVNLGPKDAVFAKWADMMGQEDFEDV